MIYTVTFNPAIDYVVRADRISLGGVTRVHGETFTFGGKGINVSAVLRTLGEESCALGFAAGFTGRALGEMLAKEGINTDFITLPSGNTRINVKIKADSETDMNAAGPDIPQAALDMLFEKLEDLQTGDFLVLAGSVPPSLPQDIYEQILKRTEKKGVRSVVDATGELLKNTLNFRPFLIKPNHHELGELFGKGKLSEAEIKMYASELQKLGARNVMVSMAGDGARLLTENGEYLRVSAPEGSVKNSVGAGDSAVAGFLTGFIKTQDYSYALKLGTAAGSATAFSDGLAEREQIKRIFREM